MKSILASAAILLGLSAVSVQAEQSIDVGEYTIHYNAQSTDLLTPHVARMYGITRSKSRGMLNVTVIKDHIGLSSLPVKAKVTGNAVNLSEQARTLNFREITDGGAIYYIAEFPVANKESMEFAISVTTDDTKIHQVSFQQQFFTE